MRNPMTVGLVLAGAMLLGATANGQTPAGAAGELRLPINRDTWVSAYREGKNDETSGNLGGHGNLKLKGVQEFSLIDFDPRPLQDRVIESAVLHVRLKARETLKRVTISTVAGDWAEGNGRSYKPVPGAASFRWARQDQLPWTYPGSDATSAILGNGQTIWSWTEASAPDAKGWQTLTVNPRLVAACSAGLSHGLALVDDVGTEYERDKNGETFRLLLFPNRFIGAREGGADSAPYLTVKLGATDRQAPLDVASVSVRTDNLPPGEAILTWATPRDNGPAGTLGFLVRYTEGDSFNWDQAKPLPRYLIPRAGRDGDMVTLHLRDMGFKPGASLTVGIRAVDAAGNIGPTRPARVVVSSALPALELTAPAERQFVDLAPLPTVGGLRVSIIDALDKVHPVTGDMQPRHEADYLQANHLFSARNKVIRLQAARNEFVGFQIVLEGAGKDISAKIYFDGGNEAPKGEVYRFRHVTTPWGPTPDPLVPLDRPLQLPATDEKIVGQRYATLLADVYVPHDAPAGLFKGRLHVNVGNALLILPIELTIWNFTLPDYLSFVPQMNCYSLPQPPLELAYYRTAHAHRTCLNRLPYNWRGQPGDGLAPRWDGRFFVWTDWDKRFGPLLDGSAFSDLPRPGVPVDAFYLMLNENWPVPIDPQFTGGYWPETALQPGYRTALVAAGRRLVDHLVERRWTDTFFEFYLNGKLQFKTPGWSKGSSPWTFDEPVNTQDFWALRWFGQAFHEGVSEALAGGFGPRPKAVFRCDISRPQWQRDILQGVLDVAVIGGDARQYQREILQRKESGQQVLYLYGQTNNPEASNLQPARWCLDAWGRGADGVIPWDTVGKDKSWEQGDPLAIFYPPQVIGLKEPAVSARLKGYRTGQQMVEYLTLLQLTTGQPRWSLANMLQAELKLGGAEELDPVALWTLRTRLGRMLDKLAPPAKRKLVDLRPPARSPDSLPAMKVE